MCEKQVSLVRQLDGPAAQEVASLYRDAQEHMKTLQSKIEALQAEIAATDENFKDEVRNVILAEHSDYNRDEVVVDFSYVDHGIVIASNVKVIPCDAAKLGIPNILRGLFRQ